MKIKWIRLRNICKELTKREVEITLSTSKNLANVNSAVSFNNIGAKIILNAEQCKKLETVIKAIAHEVAHIQNGDNSHTNEFFNLWHSIEKNIIIKYKEKRYGKEKSY
jgi:hypothetical protein